MWALGDVFFWLTKVSHLFRRELAEKDQKATSRAQVPWYEPHYLNYLGLWEKLALGH